jgi:F0F1-type ATP synthase epsilon subunit
MKNKFKLTIETPEGNLLQDLNVESISFRSEDGDIQVFSLHASLMTTIKYSRIKVSVDSGTAETFFCRSAIFNFNNSNNEAKIVAEYCKPVKEVTKESVEDYLKYLNDLLEAGKDLSQVQLVYLKDEKFAVQKMLTEE